MTTPRPNPNPIYDTFAPTALKGKVALINAVADTNFAEPLAHELGRLGARVAICSPNPLAYQAILHELLVLGRHGLAFPCDGGHDQITQEVDRLVERWGKIDLLFNLATAPAEGAAETLSLAAWHETMDQVLHSSWYFSQAAAKHMIAHTGGVIVSVLSDEAATARPETVHGAAAKAGVWNLTKTLSAEWGRHDIRVNSVLVPGPGVEHRPTAQQIAWSTVFLATDAASYITGECLDLTR